jgi:hypothetical protein
MVISQVRLNIQVRLQNGSWVAWRRAAGLAFGVVKYVNHDILITMAQLRGVTKKSINNDTSLCESRFAVCGKAGFEVYLT